MHKVQASASKLVAEEVLIKNSFCKDKFKDWLCYDVPICDEMPILSTLTRTQHYSLHSC